MEEREDMRILRRTGWRTLGKDYFGESICKREISRLFRDRLAGYTIAGARLKKITKKRKPAAVSSFFSLRPLSLLLRPAQEIAKKIFAGYNKNER